MKLEQIILYGVPLATLVNVIAGVIQYYAPKIDEKLLTTIRGALGVACLILTLNAPSLEELLPQFGAIAEQVIAAIWIYATYLGLTSKVTVRVRLMLGRAHER